MSILEFSIVLPASPEKLIQLATDYESLPKYLPAQLKSVKIINQDDNKTVTEETLVFSTIFKNEFSQQTLNTILPNNELFTEIISGPAKGTTIQTIFKNVSDGTEIHASITLKLSLKAKILSPIIKKWYKRVLMGVLYKMNNTILEQDRNK